MKLAVVRERSPERRVAATPDSVKKLVALGLAVTVEAGAGAEARFSDDAFQAAGAAIARTAAEALTDADIVFKVRPPARADLAHMKRGARLIGLLDPQADRALLDAYAAQGVDAFALEFLPRITRAQAMDALSSQANLAGYKAAIEAAHLYERVMPQMMTAAGTVAPARVFVMGAGVAGLQAIATARRLGARVSATDVRLAAKEQVQSLGAAFVMVEDEETKSAETAGGYAREMSEAYKKKQAALIAETIAKQDIVITTALIPGKPAPRLITEDMLARMKPGSVIVDLAVEQGGNCAHARAGEIVEVNGVRIAGLANLAAALPADASALYARNLVSFLEPLVERGGAALKIDWSDEIIAGTALTRDGRIVHKAFSA